MGQCTNLLIYNGETYPTFSLCKKSQTNNTIVDSNAGHLNNRPVHDMVLLLLPSGGNWNYTGWLADRLHWLLLNAALCNGWLLSAMAATVCNGCCYSMAATVCNGCCSLKWLLLSAASRSSGYTGVVVEVLDLLLVFQLKYMSNFKLFQ